MSKVFKAVGKAVTSVVKGVVKAVTSVVKAVVNVVSSVINFVAQPFMGMLGGMPDVPNAASEVERQQGVLIQTQGSNINVPVVYGYRKIAGTVVFAETGSSNNKYLYVAYVFSEGVVEGLREVFLDDWQLPGALTANLNAGQRVTVNADRYKDRVDLQWYPGVYFNNVAQSPVGATVKSGIFAEAPSFRDNMDFNGLAVLFARYEWKEIKTQADADNNPFSGNIPQIQISLLGKRVASLTSGTPEASGYDASSIRYSTNPAEILLDYLRNPRYGKGLQNDDIHWDSWKKAAAKCNTQVAYLANSNISGPIMTCNYVLPTDQTIFANVKTLLMGFRAYMPYVGGKYKLRIEDAGNDVDILSGVATIVATFNKDNIQGSITYTGIEKSAKYNVVSVSYVDPDQKFSVQQVIFPETEEERQVFIDRDGGRENKLDATFPTLTNYAMAKDMARLLFNKGRRQETCSFTASSQALELEPGDNIRIQSTILNFGTDPWRVVSVKINDNMTVEVACVRNPDDIYPYSRAGEEDVVLPVYVPKGSLIYFPSSENQAPIGLVPPNSALYPDQFPPNATNPGPTNPPVPSPSNPPVDPPPPPPFSAVLRVRSSGVTKVDEANVIFNVNFVQPDDGLYSYSILWWRYNSKSPWQERRIDTLPGVGQDIPFSLGPLPGGNVAAIYNFYVRSFATDGRASNQVLVGDFASNRSLNAAFPGLYEAPGVISASGWTLPSPVTPTATTYDANIDFFEVNPQLLDGAPLNPRRLKIRLRQLDGANIFSSKIFDNIKGFTVYYKNIDDEYWEYETFNFPPAAEPGATFEANLAGDFGARAFPTRIQVGGDATGRAQRYQFLVRLEYFDGTAAVRQLGPTAALVEYAPNPAPRDNIGYDFVVAGTSPYATGSMRNNTITPEFNTTFKTIDQRPQGVVPGSEFVPVFDFISSVPALSILNFYFKPPTSSRFRGYRIRFRPVVPGGNPEFTQLDVGSISDPISFTVIYKLTNPAYRHNETYDWVVTALYSNNGVITESDNSLVSRCRVLFSDPQYQNLVAKFNWKTQNTALATGGLVTSFPPSPVVVPTFWNLITLSNKGNYDITDLSPGGFGLPPNTTGRAILNRFFQFKFQAPVTTTALIVYRRVFNTAYWSNLTNQDNNISVWERVRIPFDDLTPDIEGRWTVNLRGPLRVTGRSGLEQFNLLAGGFYPNWETAANRLSGMAFFNGPISFGDFSRHQYLMVLEDSGVEQNKGLLLTDWRLSNDASFDPFQPVRQGFVDGNIAKDQVIDNITSAFDGVEYNARNRISNAVASRPLDKLVVQLPVGFIPAREVHSGPFTKFLLQPDSVAAIY
jgi:hypothetical protein